MTTIAYDGKTIASDGLISCGNRIERTDSPKIFKDVGGYKFIAVAGEVQKLESFLSWINNNELNMQAQPYGDYHLLFVSADDTIFEVSMDSDHGFEYKFYYDRDDKVSMGSGSDFALAAMKAGASAKEAVDIACDMDLYSGGSIVSYEL